MRSTLVTNRNVFIKFGYIPFLTRLSATKDNGQAIGFSVGEEVFVDVDLDKIYNPYLDNNGVSAFLLSVLQKHLGAKIPALMQADLLQAMQYFDGGLFQDKETIFELVNASAGIPRDFLRIFCRSFRTSKPHTPIPIRHVRLATHDFFQTEKKSPVEKRKADAVFEDIFNKICLPNNTYVFFVSEAIANNVVMREIWHHRLAHLLFQGHFGYANGQPGTYDIYVIDYGRYISMHNTKRGRDMYQKFIEVLNFLNESLMHVPFLSQIMNLPLLEEVATSSIARAIAGGTEVKSPDLEALFEDCARFVADRLVRTA